MHALDARAKIVALFAIIITCVSTPPQAWFAFFIYAAMIVIIAAVSRVPFRYLLSRVLVVAPFILMVVVFVPFMHRAGPGVDWGWLTVSHSGLLVVWNVTAKSFISVSCLILLTSTTPFTDLMHGFERLRVPEFFTIVTSFMYRYLFIIVDEAQRMKRARDSRNFCGRWLWHVKVVGHMVASLFLRCQGRAERVYRAMCARGFDGKFPGWSDRRMKIADYALIILVAATALAGRLTVLWM